MAAVHDDVYEVERLVDVRSRKKRTQYLVRWVGWAPEHDSWEDEASIHTPELIVRFNRERKLSHRKRDTHAAEVEVVEVWPDDDSGVLTVDAVVVDECCRGCTRHDSGGGRGTRCAGRAGPRYKPRTQRHGLLRCAF
eukprot:scaffold48758_cov61-Phaeocystis_antarctica.AAC.4